jgi:outer membrane protein TolC
MIQLKHIAILIFLFGLSSGLSAQDNTIEAPAKKEIPTLEELIHAALENAPMLKARMSEADAARQDVRITQKNWMNHINFDAAANYGMYDQLVVRGFDDATVIPSTQLSRGEQLRYYGGASLKIPLSAITTRRNQIQYKQNMLESAHQQVLLEQQAIRETVIKEYYNLLYMEQSVATYHEIYQTLEISFSKAERDMQQGRIEIRDFAALITTLGKARDEYNKARTDYFAQYRYMQLLTGLNFDNTPIE